MTTGEKLRIWAKKNFGSLKKLAEILEFSPVNLSMYAKDKRDPGAPFLRKIRKMGCDINWLLSEDDGNALHEPKIPYGLNAEIENLRKENRELKEKLSRINKLLNKEGK
jgi:transcriptional regulator with XRE-family HTH domain